MYQCQWAGTPYSKPTGKLTACATFWGEADFYVGWPDLGPGQHFAGQVISRYVRAPPPIPALCGHKHKGRLAGRDAE